MKKEIELIEKDGLVLVSSRVVAQDFGKRHDHVKRDIENLIESYSLILINDYFIKTTYVNRGKTCEEFLLTQEGLTIYLDSCRKDTKKLDYVYNKYADFLDRDLKVIRARKENEFGTMLIRMFPNENIVTQLQVLNYKIDFYLPFAQIVVEYDENHHKYQVEEDEVRMRRILKELDRKVVAGEVIYDEVCAEPNPHLADKNMHTYIRVEEGKEIEGVRNIMLAIEEQTWNSPTNYMR